MKKITISQRPIGERYPTYIIAEIGFLFQSFEPKNGHPGAKTLIDVAKKAGADAVKFQTFTSETIASPAAEFNMQNTGRINQRELFKKYEINRENHAKIFRYAKEKKIVVFSTPSHPKDVDLLEIFNPPAYKLGSDDLTNVPLQKYVAKTKKPMIVSTGLSNFSEVKNTVKEILKINKNLAILHCVSNYPINPSTANLKAISTLKKLNVPVGWSDHAAQNNLLVIAAVALGACIIEKHLTTAGKNLSPDAMVSATPESFKQMVNEIRIIERALGNGVKRPTELGSVYPVNRKSIVAARDIQKGEVIVLIDPYKTKKGETDVLIARPGTGLSPQHTGRGKKIRFKKNVKAWDPVKKSDIIFVG